MITSLVISPKRESKNLTRIEDSSDMSTRSDRNDFPPCECSKGRHRKLIEGIPGKYFFFSFDDQGVVTYASPSVQSLLGYAPSEVVGQNWSDIAWRHPLSTQSGTQQSGTAVEPQTHNWVVLDHEGNRRKFEVHEYTPSGEEERCAIARELSVHREDESPSEPSKTERENHSEAQLRLIANTLCNSASEEIIASFAHELIQPLTTIVNHGYTVCRQLKDNDSCPEVVQSVRTMMDSALLAAGITKRLRGSVEAGDGQIKDENMCAIIKETIRMFDQKARPRGIEIRFNDKATTEQVHADSVQVKGVLLNLVRNALQALAEKKIGKGVIEITTIVTEKFMEIVVADNGPGVRTENKNQLFSPTNSNKPSGMGIGLSICKTMVEHHGGKIWYTDNEPTGAKFHFTLPLAS